MDDRDVTAVLAEAERLVNAAGEAVWDEFVADELVPALVKVRGLVDEAVRVAAVRAAQGKPLSGAVRERLSWLCDLLVRLRAVLTGEVADAA